MKNFNLAIRDSAHLISNSEFVLGKPCMTDDEFEANFEENDEFINDQTMIYRLKRIYYHEEDEVIYLTSCFFEYTDNFCEIQVEYLKVK